MERREGGREEGWGGRKRIAPNAVHSLTCMLVQRGGI